MRQKSDNPRQTTPNMSSASSNSSKQILELFKSRQNNWSAVPVGTYEIDYPFTALFDENLKFNDLKKALSNFKELAELLIHPKMTIENRALFFRGLVTIFPEKIDEYNKNLCYCDEMMVAKLISNIDDLKQLFHLISDYKNSLIPDLLNFLNSSSPHINKLISTSNRPDPITSPVASQVAPFMIHAVERPNITVHHTTSSSHIAQQAAPLIIHPVESPDITECYITSPSPGAPQVAPSMIHPVESPSITVHQIISPQTSKQKSLENTPLLSSLTILQQFIQRLQNPAIKNQVLDCKNIESALFDKNFTCAQVKSNISTLEDLYRILKHPRLKGKESYNILNYLISVFPITSENLRIGNLTKQSCDTAFLKKLITTKADLEMLYRLMDTHFDRASKNLQERFRSHSRLLIDLKTTATNPYDLPATEVSASNKKNDLPSLKNHLFDKKDDRPAKKIKTCSDFNYRREDFSTSSTDIAVKGRPSQPNTSVNYTFFAQGNTSGMQNHAQLLDSNHYFQHSTELPEPEGGECEYDSQGNPIYPD